MGFRLSGYGKDVDSGRSDRGSPERTRKLRHMLRYIETEEYPGRSCTPTSKLAPADGMAELFGGAEGETDRRQNQETRAGPVSKARTV
jgi:hypothetical protein